jgi:hypothetical protein
MNGRTVIGVGSLAAVVSGGGWLIKQNWWPQGSDNMFVVTDGTPVEAIVVCSDQGEILWRIVATGQGSDLKSVPYGQVPPRFRQEVPRQGSPRAFVKDELLQVHVLSRVHDMADGGRATGPREFLTLVNFSGNRSGPSEQLDCRRP